jgi:hypothetical protein
LKIEHRRIRPEIAIPTSHTTANRGPLL